MIACLRAKRWKMRRGLQIARVWCFSAVTAWGALNICPDCGFENEPKVGVCEHCGNHYAPPKDADAEEKRPEQEKPAEAEVSARFPLEASVVKEHVEISKTFYDSGRPAVSMFFVRNAICLIPLVPPDSRDPAWGEQFVNALGIMQRDVLFPEITCEACAGTGRFTPQRKGNETAPRTWTQPCIFCKGNGMRRHRLSDEQVLATAVKAKSEYEILLRGKGYVQEGDAWLPREVEAGLSLDQQVALRKAAAPECMGCLGSGRSACETCDGLGAVPCDACQQGWVIEAAEPGTIGADAGIRKKCPNCQGQGLRLCKACKGTCSTVCEVCEGEVKGERCRRCGGEGKRSCRHCRGDGEYRGAKCERCDGVGQVICDSCHGAGRRIR